MMVRPDMSNLTLPRYVPFVLKGTLLALWHDRQEDQYVLLCPQCHQLITYDTLSLVYREIVWSERKCCQGCRAKISFERDPGLIGVFLEFWYKTGNFPESLSWLEAISPQQFNLWPKAIRAALEAERKNNEVASPAE